MSPPIPHPGNTCLTSRPALENLVRRNKRHTDTKHTYAALVSSHQAWDICGFLRMPVCSSNLSKASCLLHIYAHTASTTTGCPNSISSDGSPGVGLLFILWKEGVEENWWGGKEERTLLSTSHETPQCFQTSFCHVRGKICFNLYILKL